MWWPGSYCGRTVTQFVENCTACFIHRQQAAELLIKSTLPLYSWKCIITDLFELKSHTYLIAVDSFSRYTDTVKLPQKDISSMEVISYLKSIMACHEIPDEIVSDNGPQFSAEVLTKFTKLNGITHQTSNSRYPQGNGEAERVVKTVKSILNKSEDPYLGLMTYCTTAIHNGYRPSQLLIGQTLRSTILQLQTHFVPQLPNQTQLTKREQKVKQHQKNLGLPS